LIDSEKSVDDRANYKRCLHGRIVWEMKWEWIDGRIISSYGCRETMHQRTKQ